MKISEADKDAIKASIIQLLASSPTVIRYVDDFPKSRIIDRDCNSKELQHGRALQQKRLDRIETPTFATLFFFVADLILLFVLFLRSVVRAQLITVLGVILSNDFPAKYPGYLATVQTLLQSQDPKIVFVGLLALKEVLRVYKYANSTLG